MTAFQEPLERGWLRTVLNDVRAEVDTWPDQKRSSRSELANESTPEGNPPMPKKTPSRPAKKPQPDVITLLADVLAHTQAPRSMGMLGAANKSWDELRTVLNLFGYMSTEEIEQQLRLHL
jgi:hypothetical protein